MFAHQALLSTMATRSGEILRHSSKAGIQWMPNVAVAARDPFHYRFCRRSSNSMAISFYSHFDFNTAIATKFCTWHDSCAVVACPKTCCDLMTNNGNTTRQNSHRIWIASIQSLVKRSPLNGKALWRNSLIHIMSTNIQWYELNNFLIKRFR